MKAPVLVLLLAASVLAKKGEDPPPPPSMLEEVIVGPATDVINAGKGLAMDAADLLLGVPKFYADVTVYLIGLLREVPSFSKALFNAETATLNRCAKFTVTTASSVFVLYAALAALNLLLAILCSVKDGHKSYLTLPKKVLGQNVANPVFDAIQKYMLDPIIAWKNPKVLSALVGEPTVGETATSVADAMVCCMILACTPDVLGLISNGASKAGAEAVAWTLGTALGVKYFLSRA